MARLPMPVTTASAANFFSEELPVVKLDPEVYADLTFELPPSFLKPSHFTVIIVTL